MKTENKVFSYRPHGLMDKASDFGSEDSRFESWCGRNILQILVLSHDELQFEINIYPGLSKHAIVYVVVETRLINSFHQIHFTFLISEISEWFSDVLWDTKLSIFGKLCVWIL